MTSFLVKKGMPGVVERTLIRPPSSHLGPLEPPERQAVIEGSPVAGKYEALQDRESAYEMLAKRAEEAAKEAEQAESQARARFDLMLHSAPAVVYSFGATGDFIQPKSHLLLM